MSVDVIASGPTRAPALRQTADAVFMLRPAGFGWNPETEASNRFQRSSPDSRETQQRKAVAEFDAVAFALRTAGVDVHALEEPAETACPDAVFPNNWVSLHHDGTVVLYPMQAPSRRLERRTELLAALEERGGFAVARLVDLSYHELSGRFLEGTGSVVFDHVERTAYACLSPRTHPEVFAELCNELGYEPVTFEATDASGVPVYHTNVLLSIGTRFAIICADAIGPRGRGALLERLGATGRRVVAIERSQMCSFAGNALELGVQGGGTVLAMSARARQSLKSADLKMLQDCVPEIIAAPIPTIEDLGGGSVRCMLAEVFLPRRSTRTPEAGS